MSTTVTYKGSTLTTATNQTKVLETAGKYMEDDVTIVDVTAASPTLQAKTYTVSAAGTDTIEADSGYDGLSEVEVTVPSGSFNDLIQLSNPWWSYSVDENDGTVRGTLSATELFNAIDDAGYINGSTKLAINLYEQDPNPYQLSTQSATTITPTESQQTAVAKGKFTTGAVTVGAISSSYVGSGITRRDSTDLTASGATVSVPSGYYASNVSKSVSSGTVTGPTSLAQVSNYSMGSDAERGTLNIFLENIPTTPTVSAGYVSSASSSTRNAYCMTNIAYNPALTVSGATVTAPAGYYPNNKTQSVASGTEGTPTATKGTVTNHSVSVTPSVTNSAGYISGGTKTGTAVTVSASELVSGTYTVDSSGTKDVTNYASASVPAMTLPSSASSTSSGTYKAYINPTTDGSLKYINIPTGFNNTAQHYQIESVLLDSLTATDNGTYDPADYDCAGFSSVTVNVSGGTAAISVVDTTDSAGGTIRTITALDISDTTAVASDVTSGKYFYTAAGVKTAGTGSGGGSSNYTRTVIAPQQTVSPDSNRQAELTHTGEFEDGDFYIVTLDGTEWACTCETLWTDNLTIGDCRWWFGSTSDAQYPFGGIGYDGDITIAFADTNQHTIKIEHLNFVTSGTAQHSIYFEFSDSTNTTINAWYNDSFISNAITATTPTTYNNKTVTLAQLDGTTWYEPQNIPLNTELIDFTKIVVGYVIDGDNGEETTSQWSCCSDYTVIDPTMTFSYIGYRWYYIAFYNSSKTFISSIYMANASGTLSGDYLHGTLSGSDIPSNAMYIRISTNPTNPTSSQLSLIRTA